MSCGVGRRCGSDLCVAMAVAVAVVQIQPLAWELPYATSSALKRQKPTNQPTKQTKTSAFLFVSKASVHLYNNNTENHNLGWV